MKLALRLEAVAVLLIAGCSSSERAIDAAPSPRAGNERAPAAAAGASEPSGAIKTSSASPLEAEPQRGWDAGLMPFFRDPVRASCPFPASTCSGDCVPVTGRLPDEGDQCLSPVVVGCVPAHGNWVTGGETSPNCFKREDGALLETRILYLDYLGPHWSVCTRGDRDRIASAPPCAGERAASP